MMAMGPFLPYSPADEMMGPAIPADRLVYDSTSGGYTAAPPAEEEKVAPEVKSAVDTVLGLWGTSNSKGSHQYVLRDFSDAADSVPVDPSKASDSDRLKYAMQILEAGQNAKTQFSDKGLNAWKAAVSPLMGTYAPAQKFQWIGTTEDGGPDYGQWAQIASSVGFNGPTYIEQSVPSGYDENGNQTFSVGYGISPEFKAFVDKAHEQGYGFVQHADNIVNFNQRYGFRLPDGSIQGQYSVRDDQSVRDFGMSLLPIASMMLGVPGVGGALAQTIGSTVLPASAAAAASTAINTALASTGLSVSAAAVTSAVGQAAIQSGLSALGGGDAEDVIRAGITGLVGNAVAPAVNAAVPGSLGALEKVAERAITSATMSAISGQGDPGAAALGSLTSSLPGATGVPPALLQGALQLATTGTVTPSALINAATSLGRTSGTSQTGSSIGASYDDPSRTTDVVAELEDILGTPSGGGTLLAGPMDAMDFSAPNRAEQKTQVADYIRNQAANGVKGFEVGPGGVLEVEDPDRGITHRFTSDGSVLGSVDTVFGSKSGNIYSTSAGVKDFLSNPYVQGLFEGGNGSGGGDNRYMVPEVDEDVPATDGLTQEQSDELLRQAERDLMEEELYQVNSPVTLPSTDVNTTVDSGQSVFDQIDQELAKIAQDRQEELRQAVTDPARVDGAQAGSASAATGSTGTAESGVGSGSSVQSTAQSWRDRFRALSSDATTVQPTNQITSDQVQQIVADALRNNPGVTTQQVQSIVDSAINSIPPGLTQQDVTTAVNDAIARLPQAPTRQDIDAAIGRAMTNVATQQDVRDAIAGIQFPPGITQQDVTSAISQYMQQNPGLSAQDVAAQVSGQLAKLPAYATPADVNTAISSAMSNVATRADVQAAIRDIQFPAGISEADVTRAISDYMRQNPGLSAADIASEVSGQLSKLPAYATPADVNAAINGAMSNVATKSDVQAAIRDIQFPAGISEADVTRAISDYMRQNPGLSAQDVAGEVAGQLSRLPAYATPADVNAAISGAMANVATRSDVEAAIRNIQFPAGISQSDVTRAISQYMQQNPGLSAQDVASEVAGQLSRLPAYATPDDVNSAIQGAMRGVATSEDVRRAIEGIQFPAGITEADVTRAVSDYMRQNPGLSAQDVSTQVAAQLKTLPAYATPADVDNAIRGVMEGVATTADVRRAIEGIQFPEGITQEDVTQAISTYMQQNPGLSAQDVAAQVADQLKTLPAYATPADVESAIQGAMTNVATRADVEKAIQGIQFPTGISRADVTDAITQYMRDNPGLSADEVTSLVGQQLSRLPAYATPDDVNASIRGAMADVATRSDVQEAIAGIQFPAGISRADVTDVITDYMRQNPGLSAAEVTSLVGEQLSRLPAFATPQDVESTVRGALAGYATSEDVSGLGRGLEAVRADLTQLIADAQASGLKGDAALNASLEALAGELGTTRKGLMDSLGVTESALRSEFASQIGGVQTQMTELGQSLQSAIADARSAGLQGDEALQVGLESLAGRLGTTRDDLLATLGATEQSLRSDFASQLGGVSSQISNVQTLLLDKINAAYSVGLQGDEALRAGLDSLAADLGTTQANLLSQLGTTEAALRSQFGSQIGEVRTQVGQLGQDLQDAIDSARRSGLQGDAALQAGLDTLAGSLGTTRSELLSQLGTTEQALRSDFASQLGGVQSQVTQLGSDLSSAIESARAAGLQGDAALQAGLDTLANRLGTTTDQLLSQLGTTESALRSQFGAQIGEVQTQVGQLSQDLQASIDSARRAGLQGDAALQAGLDTLANRLGTTTDQLLSQLGATEQGLRSQFAGQLGEVQSSLTGQIGGVEERLNSRIEDLVDQGVDFQTATNQALKEVTGSLGTLAEQQQQESERTQTAIGSVETRLGDRINDLMQQGLDWQEATNLAIAEVSGSVSSLAEQTQSSISGLGLDIQSQIEEITRQNYERQASSDMATLEYLLRLEAAQEAAAERANAAAAAQAQRDAAAAEAQAQRDAAAAAAQAQRDAAAAEAQADQSRRQQLMTLASSYASQGAGSGVSDPYKATFLSPFIVGGKAPEKFEGALSGFLKEATTGDFLPDKPQQQSTELREDEPMTGDQYFGGTAVSPNPLDLYQPEQEYTGLFGFRAGGMVPFMAQGGTRYGHNAHGALNVLEHSGKHRVDYRQGDAVTGIGDGQSDDIPAMLADGEFVIPADVVAALGNGSTKAGSDKLYEMMHNIRRHHRSAGPKDLPPPAKAPLEYIKSRKGRSA